MNRVHRGWAKTISGTKRTPVTTVAMARAQRIPCLARSQFPAPTFWPTKVVAVTDSVVMGRMTKASIF